jgi:hypothetical protein
MIRPFPRSLALKSLMLRKQLIAGSLLLCLVPLLGKGQRSETVKNLPAFDQRLYHFGFNIGYNRADYFLEARPRINIRDSLQTMRSISRPGFDLGIISALHFNKNWSLRFLPGLSFQDHVVRYSFLKTDSTAEVIDKRIGSTFIDVPLNIKFRTDRVNNFAAYVIGGAKWSIDMASNEDVENQASDRVVLKMHPNDYAAQIGGGFDFFLEYFKFGIELKFSVGLRDMMIHEDTRFSRPIQGARTKKYLLSFTFEG